MSLWEPFQEPARRAIVLAQEAAMRAGDNHVGSEHIVLALGEIDESPLLPLFEERGLSLDALRERVVRNALRIESPGESLAALQTEMVFTVEAKRMIELAFACARELNTNFIAAEHLIAALQNLPESEGAKHLVDLGFDLDAIADRMKSNIRAMEMQQKPEVSSARRSYLRFELNESEVSEDPLVQLERWLTEAIDAKLIEPNAVSVATVAPNGQPSSRIVLLRGLDERGLVFYTSYLSRKGTQIQNNAKVAALFYWAELERQVRIEGSVEQVSEEESDAYFASRPRGHQLSAWASEQSEPLQSPALLAQRVEDYASRFEGEDVPRPHSWGGFLIRPNRIEFWQGREHRLHDRLEFIKDGITWNMQRLSP